MPNGRKVKAVIPGGSSAPVLSPDELDIALEFEALKAKQIMAGLRRRHRHGRPHLHGAQPLAASPVLRRGELRPVHPLPRGHPLDDASLRKIEEGRGTWRTSTSMQRGQLHRPIRPSAWATPSARWATRRRCRCTFVGSSCGSAPSSRPHIHGSTCPFRPAQPWGEFESWS